MKGTKNESESAAAGQVSRPQPQKVIAFSEARERTALAKSAEEHSAREGEATPLPGRAKVTVIRTKPRQLKRGPSQELRGVVDAILSVGNERKGVLNQMRAALISGCDSEALELARRLCGLTA